MSRVVLVQPGSGAPEYLTIEAWRALTSMPVFLAPGDPLADRLRDNDYLAAELSEADPALLVSEDAAKPASGLRGKNLLAPHEHGSVPPGARSLASRLAELSREHDQIAFVVRSDVVTKAVVQMAFEDPLVEVEFVVGAPPRGHTLLELVRVMARLRGPGGCPWDAEQTHQTLAKHLLDETYELLDAIETGTEDDIAEELGDLLLQVVFHAQMGADARAFDIDDVARGLIDKLVRRHPHVFGDVEVSGAGEVVANWDVIKQHEKQRESVLDGVPEALPALAYAQKLQRRAASAGFDFRKGADALAKVREEVAELEAAASDDEREAEFGDLLFALVLFGRHLGVDAETALRRSARTFRDRLMHVEREARERGVSMKDMTVDELQALWSDAKRS